MNDPGAAWQQAMRRGDFAAAWRINDDVLAARDPRTRDDAGHPYHQRWVWDGTAPDERDVLVRCYHGLGDTLQFARFLPALRARSATLTVECQPALLPLLVQMPQIDRLHPFDPAHPLPAAPCTLEIMELGHVLRPDAEQIAGAVPYLRVAASAAWQGSTALCWESGRWDTARSVSLDRLLRALPPGRFISLQRGVLPPTVQAARFYNPHDDDTSILRTAALIRASRRVVTVDTMVAHLTGALGHRGIVVLKEEADWRWGDGAGRAVWYPSLLLCSKGLVERG